MEYIRKMCRSNFAVEKNPANIMIFHQVICRVPLLKYQVITAVQLKKGPFALRIKALKVIIIKQKEPVLLFRAL